MKLTTKYKINQHKRHCPKVFRLDARVTASQVVYRCEFEAKTICVEKRVNKALQASNKAYAASRSKLYV